MKNISIIGGGINGIFCAYYLHKSGHKVTVFDKNEIGTQCSYGNAGLIVPSHFETLSNPHVLKKGLKWMFNPNSPFFFKPRLDLDLIKWVIKFNSFCTQKHVDENKYFLKDISLYSLKLYEELKQSKDFTFDLNSKGLLVVCKREKTLKEEESLVKQANDIGLRAKMLNNEEIKAMEPNINLDIAGAAYFKDDSNIQPYDLIISIKHYLQSKGVVFYENCTIEDFKIKNSKIVCVIDKEAKEYKADEFIFTMGILTSKIAKKFKLNLLMQGGKGFSFKINKNNSLNFSTPMILAEEKVAITPYHSYVRFAGTMIICKSDDLSITQRRVNNIKKAANSYIKNLNIKKDKIYDIWAGLRPCSPDGLPYIGRSKEISNLVIATGHSMIGISLGPATGKLVSNIIDEHKDIKINRLNLYRF